MGEDPPMVVAPLSIATAESEPELQLEIAHVLFIDIVGYSKLLNNQQHDSLRELNPEWNALRGDVRFEKIVASLSPKEIKL